MANVYREVWTGEVIKAFEWGLKDTFLDGVQDYSRHVTGNDEVQAIHSIYFGVRPDVLINNTTYPISIQELDGDDITITLDKYQTTVTPITDDELFALSYDKIKTVKDSHSDAIVENRLRKAAHALAPLNHDIQHPVLLTTGELVGNRRRLRWEDIINVRSAYARAKIKIEGLRFILCPDHVNDLLNEEKSLFGKSYANFQGGVITNQLGFEFREYELNPYYNVATKTKVSLGTIPDDDVHSQASFVFPLKKTGRATGLTKMYWSEAKNDPTMQRNLVSFRNYFIAMPLVLEGFAAIISPKS
ncbi:hypothetical protein [Dysgonomonas sp. HGC4]|uniref:hypothetical protein n=1 Tax=Dysgonomonas sp. HGC4 TaxID=1658009 RepID=UPI000680C04F|nr:hypothetical protein [Dysgonomonas sp. HGC4]MBD8348584.1 hypothetical protein [Dysgonomonas sp. HGC4]